MLPAEIESDKTGCLARRLPEAIVIHEMLHSLGLGENPPTSDYITLRVMERCHLTPS